MKNLKLKKNVFNVLYVGIGIIVIAFMLKIITNEYNEAVDRCVKSGNSYEYCTNGLK